MSTEQKIIISRLTISSALFILSLFSFLSDTAKLIISLVAYLIISYDIIFKSFRGIFKGKIFDERFLMLIASVGAFILQEYHEALAVIILYQLGEFLQDLAVDKSKDSIKALLDIRPDTAHIETDGEIKTVSPNDVKVGEIITVFAGEKISLDGIVVSGEGSVSTSALTGESLPTEISSGSEVLSGMVNLSSTIKVQVTKPFKESTISKIIEMVEVAEEKKAKSQTFIRKFAKIYTPVVVLCAVLLAIIPPLTFSFGNWSDWIYRALTFLVISCPCALVISIPLSFYAGIGGASKQGILIKGATYIEQLAKTTCVAFDKTGTLTTGNFSVSGIYADQVSEKKLLEIATLAEHGLSHPIAKSIQEYTKNYNFDTSKITSQENLSGFGVKVKIKNETYFVGSKKLIDSLNLNTEIKPTPETTIYIATENKLLGHITISDNLKSTSKQSIENLRAIGIKNVIMLTGDKSEISQKFADELNLSEAHAELLPNDKAKIIENLKSKGEVVCFVGDGINDAPVLATSDVGISMGKLGSDIAINSADVVIMDDNPEKVARSIKHSKKVMKIVHQNLVFTIGFKMLMLILELFGFVPMWLAIFADVGVSLIAILNALRVLKTKKS